MCRCNFQPDFFTVYTFNMHILRFKKCKYCAMTGLILCISVVMSLIFQISVNNLKETEKCPICFGLAGCQFIDNNEITIYKDINTLFTNIFGMKNVYYGKLKNVDVILKKLAHCSEFKAFDETISKIVIEKNSDFQKLIEREVNADMKDTMSKLRLCPTVKHMNLLFSNILVKDGFMYEHLWTLIKINPEPLILQILPAENGWPVPKYYGACGRLVIQEFAGPSLTSFFHEPWIRRAIIASTLLDAAYMFTFRDENFAYYLTDISFDNIAVDSKNRAKFVDLENVIIVDKITSAEDQPDTWQAVHRSDGNFDCETCFVFSPIDICEHKVSDHNYYAICKHILAQRISERQISKGFLHDVPTNILGQFPSFINLISQCAEPDSFHQRISNGIKLNKLLKNILINT